MAKILDTILCTIMAFGLSFYWITYCVKNSKTALILSAVIAVCCCYVVFQLLTKLQGKRTARAKHKKTIENFAKYLQFNTDNASLFEQLFRFFGYETQKIDFDNLIAEKDKKMFVAICFQTAKLTESCIQKAIVSAKRANCDKLLIFANKTENNLMSIARQQLPTDLSDTSNCLALFEKAEKLPPFPEIKEHKTHLIAAVAFNRKRFGQYFSCAFFTLLCAAFSFVKLYLLIWSTVLFLLAAYSLLNKKYNRMPTNIAL